MPEGYLALVLHGHLPFVKHPEVNDSLEERWFFEALSECYLPLLKVMEDWERDGVYYRLALSLSPTLMSMFRDPLLQSRYLDYLEKTRDLAEKEIERNRGQPDFQALALMYREHFSWCRHFFQQEKNQDLLGAFGKLQGQGGLELFTCCGTHPYLPLLGREESVKAHIQAAVEEFNYNFGRYPPGMWLPECGYRPGVERHLEESGINYFFLDAHGILYASPRPRYGVHVPVLAGKGIAAFGRDPEASRQVWSKQEGYPGDYAYREYYRDIGFDREEEYLRPYLASGVRRNTGIKYYRVTGKTEQKEAYNPRAARERAEVHAGNFMFNREKQVEFLARHMDSRHPPVITAPYDAELFGHWWYEGPQWLDFLVRKISCSSETLELVSPSSYLAQHPPEQEVTLYLSSWGHEGYNQVWLNSKNDWVYRHLHKAENRMAELAQRNYQAPGPYREALQQAARELMLAQASDWTFIITTGTVVEYALNRIQGHLEKFNRLYQMIQEKTLDQEWLARLEIEDNLFPHLDPDTFIPQDFLIRKSMAPGIALDAPRVLMLSWEFPPHTVGGLARHVYQLSRALVPLGVNLHVVTNNPGGKGKGYENLDGVQVHRLTTFQPEGAGTSFHHWIFQLNLVIFQYVRQLTRQLGPFDLVHAHDWLVAYGASYLKDSGKTPLLATIHATEYGRNQGIHTEQQKYINEVEWWLTYEAWRVIVCSHYMQQELEDIFHLPGDKIRVIPNGVDPDSLKPESFPYKWREKYARPQEKIVFSVGRLVWEKGLDTLLEAVPLVVQEHPAVKFVIAGTGPQGEELQQQARRSGIQDRVLFTGLVTDQERNRLYACSDIAVFPSRYEPFGIVALEAMAARVPVVVGNTGGLGEIIEHGSDGFKFPPGDAPQLARAITRLLKEPGLAEVINHNAWQKVIFQYNWQEIAVQTRKVYMEVLKERKAQLQVD